MIIIYSLALIGLIFLCFMIFALTMMFLTKKKASITFQLINKTEKTLNVEYWYNGRQVTEEEYNAASEKKMPKQLEIRS